MSEKEGVKALFFCCFKLRNLEKIGFTLTRSPFYGTNTLIFFRCKQEITTGFNLEKEVERMKLMFIILFILFIGIPLLKEEMENQNYRESCRRRGDKTYWSTDGLRYTSNNQKVYK